MVRIKLLIVAVSSFVLTLKRSIILKISSTRISTYSLPIRGEPHRSLLARMGYPGVNTSSIHLVTGAHLKKQAKQESQNLYVYHRPILSQKPVV